MSPRVDVELVTRGLARSRGAARDLLESDRVRLNGRPVHKASSPVAVGDDLVVMAAGPDWVGRAALKLVAAVEAFGPHGWSVSGRRCVDVGASTGGFTQVLLHEGAASVASIDVGRGQLVRSLAEDDRVTEWSGTTVRGIDVAGVGGPFERLVADLSFISLTLVAADLAGLLAADGEAVVLIKPQFEVGRNRLGKNGLVRRSGDRAESITTVGAAFGSVGLRVRRLAASPITGSTGNAEYLAWLTRDFARALPWESVVRTADTLAVNGES